MSGDSITRSEDYGEKISNHNEYVNSVLKSGQMSTSQLRQEAEDFINYNFNLGNDTRGKIWRSKYQECGKIYIYNIIAYTVDYF